MNNLLNKTQNIIFNLCFLVLIVVSSLVVFEYIENSELVKYIMIACFSIQSLIILTIIATFIKAKSMKFVTIQRFSIKNSIVKANDFIMPKFIKSTNPSKISVIRVHFTISPLVTNFEIFNKTEKIKAEQIISSEGSIDNNKFNFVAKLFANPSDELNFRFNEDTNIEEFDIEEHYLP